jgi:hypothetical protein
MTNSWTFRRRSDVERFWRDVRDAPRRTNGRKHYHEERFCLGLYLLALATHHLLTYPLHVEQGESPDFMLTWKSGETTGLEVTRATEPSLQRAMTAADREFARREGEAARSGGEPEPVGFLLSETGWTGDQAELEWCRLVGQCIERKLDRLLRFRQASRHDLLVYDETPLPVVDRRKVFSEVDLWARSLRRTNGSALGKISVIMSLDVAFDLGGDFQILPFVEWSAPKLDDHRSALDFAHRAEYAARKAAEVAIKGRPAYFEDSLGRIVKRTLEGRRFEVRIPKGGGEVVVREFVRE